jgi:type IV pilus assembly protein PilE
MLQTLTTPSRRHGGFTLIELMITVAIVAILAAVAYPSFMEQVRKSRRSDAITALNAVAQAQEPTSVRRRPACGWWREPRWRRATR